MNLYDFTELLALSDEPSEKAQFDAWVEQPEVPRFLQSEALDEYVIVYASMPNVFLHAMLALDFDVGDQEVIDGLLGWNFNPYGIGWGEVYSSDDVWVEAPLASQNCRHLKEGEPLLFGRTFEGHDELGSYIELNQKVAHILGLHRIEEREAWCKLDKFGDIDEVVKVIRFESKTDQQARTVVAFKISELASYAGIQGFCILRMFDFTRYKSGNFMGFNQTNAPRSIRSNNVFGTLNVTSGFGSYSRGIQKIDVAISKHEIKSMFGFGGDKSEEKEYATFIANDWKNKEITEISCDPKLLGNYFVESEFPFTTSPAFFRPEVLSKYKADRDKYKLEDRTVSCRGAWYLKTYDINDAGQVHTYVGYLGDLPHEEQLHWKQFNEEPKAGISDRAYKTDFEGCWDETYDPLPSLKLRLRELQANPNCDWWKLREASLPEKVNYPVTQSRDEWAEELLNLDQLVVEGLSEKSLRQKAKELGCETTIKEVEKKTGRKLRALKLLEHCMIGAGESAEDARELLSPFHEVHNYRSIFKGHASGKEANEIQREVMKKHTSLKSHFVDLCRRCDETLRSCSELLCS